MKKISLDYSKSFDFFSKYELENLAPQIELANKILKDGKGAGNEYLGWVDLPQNYDKNELNRIKIASEKIKKDSDILIVIGIGGSYLGSKAVIEAINHTFFNDFSKKNNLPKIYFAGQNISGRYLEQLLEVIEGKDVSINIISKSGTTLEPALAFRVLKKYLEDKYGEEEAKNRIYVTTDKEKGALRELSDKKKYETFSIPDDVGGRFSVLTAVGLLPIACAGIDIEELMNGAKGALEDFTGPIEENICFQYAAIRNILYRKNISIEVLGSYDPRLFYIGEWWKQLYGESEGKDKKGLFPASVNFSTDLHSMGQYIQDGKRILMETILKIENTDEDIEVKEDIDNLDNLNYLSGKTMNFINNRALEATALSHIDGGVPNIIINIPEITPYYIGYLIYFFEKACAISGYLLGVNPFDQPGVEAYKKNMFALLGKPGFEERQKELLKRLENK